MNKILRNKSKGMIFGVCAGLSDYTGIDATLIRLATIIGTIVTGSVIFWLYLILAILLPTTPQE